MIKEVNYIMLGEHLGHILTYYFLDLLDLCP